MCQVSCKTNQVLATLCAKVPKKLKESKNCNLLSNFKNMTMIYNSSHFHKIYIPISVVCKVSCKANQVLTTLYAKVLKSLKTLN